MDAGQQCLAGPLGKQRRDLCRQAGSGVPARLTSTLLGHQAGDRAAVVDQAGKVQSGQAAAAGGGGLEGVA